MIKKLRRKFVFINAVLMFIIFFSILFVLVYGIQYEQAQAGYSRLEMVLERGYGKVNDQLNYNDRAQQQYNVEPGFCVKVNNQGDIILIDMQYYREVSSDMMERAVRHVAQEEEDRGVIRDMELRYVRWQTRNGLRIAFADISTELEQYSQYIGVGIAILVGGSAVVLALAWLLAELALRPVEQAWIQQEQFVADASHEIKTPLTIILSNTGILLRQMEEEAPERRKWVEYIRVEADRMKELVENMLFLAKSDAGQEKLTLSEVNLSELVWKSLLPFDAIAYERGITIRSEVAENVMLYGDAKKLGSLIRILLDNACKHAPAGGTVTVKLTTRQDRVYLSVNNPAAEVIPKDKLEKIFDRFYRADEARDRERGGYGLGLAIAKTLVELHGGRILAESSKKKGVTFRIDFGKNSKLRKQTNV